MHCIARHLLRIARWSCSITLLRYFTRRSLQSGGRTFSLRSEEHTSELQSRQYLVCRLLLEKTNTPLTSSDATIKHSSRCDLLHLRPAVTPALLGLPFPPSSLRSLPSLLFILFLPSPPLFPL